MLSEIIQAQEDESHHSHSDAESKSAELMRMEGERWLLVNRWKRRQLFVYEAKFQIDRKAGFPDALYSK